MDEFTLVLTVALIVEIVAAMIATVYVTYRYNQLEDKAPFLARLVLRDARVAFGGALIGIVIVYSLIRYSVPGLQLGPIPPPIGAFLIALPVSIMLLGPIWDAITWWREGHIQGERDDVTGHKDDE